MPMASVVVDASIVVQWVIEEPGSETARAHLEEWLEAGVQPIAPSWLTCEVANILYKKVLRGELSPADAGDAYDDVLPFLQILAEDAPDGKRALAIAQETGQQQAYDAQYLALAERLGVEYWTDDRRFVLAASGAFPQVKHLGSV
jgi:predicted nucleic acid-binding protein